MVWLPPNEKNAEVTLLFKSNDNFEPSQFKQLLAKL